MKNKSFVATDGKKKQRRPGVVSWRQVSGQVKEYVLTSVGGLFGNEPTKFMPRPEEIITRLTESFVVSSGKCEMAGKEQRLVLLLSCEGGRGKTLMVYPKQIACSLRDGGGKTRVRLDEYRQTLTPASV